MSNYIMGRRLEYRIRDIFRREGYLVIRAASSKPIDLVCIKNGKTVLVECKAGRSWLGKGRAAQVTGLSPPRRGPNLFVQQNSRNAVVTIHADGNRLEGEDLISFILLTARSMIRV